MYRTLSRISASLAILVATIVAGGCDSGLPPANTQSGLDVTPPHSHIPTPSDAGASAGPTSTVTPTLPPSPTPSPTPDPAALLSQAQRALHNGDYAAAIDAYRAVLTFAPAVVDPLQGADVFYGLGESYLGARQYADAAGTFAEFASRYPADPRAGRALFLQGTSLQYDAQWQPAIVAYQGYLSVTQVISPHVWSRIATCHEKASPPSVPPSGGDTAIAALEHVVDGAWDTSMAADALERIADHYKSQEDYAAAIATYDRILALAKNRDYIAQITYLKGAAYLEWEKPDEAKTLFHEVVRKYPTATHAYWALLALLDEGDETVPQYNRGVIYYHGDDYNACIQAMYTYIEAYPKTHTGQAHYYAGLSYRALGQYAAAAREFDGLIRTHPEYDRLPDAWWWKARSLASAGSTSAALTAYRTLAEKYPKHSRADDALRNAAYLLKNDGQLTRAATAFEEMQETYPKSEYAPGALWEAGYCRYLAGDYTEAAGPWIKLAETYPRADDEFTQGLFWLGKAAQKDGADDAARAYWQRALEADPHGYYGLRARDHLSGTQVLTRTPGVTLNITMPTRSEQVAFEEWLAGWTGQPRYDYATRGLSTTITSHVAFQRGDALWAVGLHREAQAQFKTLREAFERDPVVMYQLTMYFQEIGAYGESIRAMGRIIVRSPEGKSYNCPIFLRKLFYPVYYADLIVPGMERYGMDPLWFFALVWQESFFDRYGRSWAEARGLTQVIPSTGEYIAGRLKVTDYRLEDLYRPVVSVRFGTWYFAEGTQDFDDQVFYGLAAYNGGYGNVQRRWSQGAAADDLDIFVETIHLDEAYRYVKRVYEHYAVYRDIYGR